MGAFEREPALEGLIAAVMRGNRPLTERQIVSALQRRARFKTTVARVRAVLCADPHRFMPARARFRVLWRRTRWRLVEAGPSSDPGSAGAPVPARPHRPLLSGAAAAELVFRDDDPWPSAVGPVAT